ncbi:MAG: LuxR C-terminal-related transcriptional regulator [Pseudomonadota bacterium]|nr:LuxR C-terminal-related transcriptional regulator [Pseudomonadota bacterium]
MTDRVEKFAGALIEIDNLNDLSQFYCEYVTSRFGQPYVSYLVVADKFKQMHGPNIVRAATLPEGFQEDYEYNELSKIDPILRLAQVSGLPVSVKDASASACLSGAEREFLESLPKWGIRDAVALTVCTHPGQIAYAGCGTDSPRLSLSTLDLRAFYLIAHEMHARYRTLSGVDDQTKLTSRELEIMKWIVQGKSNAFIANNLEISPHTVDTLVRRCFGKLNAKTRLEAALKSVSLGIALA